MNIMNNFKSLDQKILEGYSVAILSAYLSDSTEEINIRRTKAIGATCINIGLGHFFVEGHWDTPSKTPEDLVVVCAKYDDPTTFGKQLVKLVSDFNINSWIVLDGSQFHIYDHHTKSKLLSYEDLSLNSLSEAIKDLRSMDVNFVLEKERHDVGFIGRLKL